jgi:hypothetical protein
VVPAELDVVAPDEDVELDEVEELVDVEVVEVVVEQLVEVIITE